MLTGKDVYEAARPHIVKHGFEDLEWEDFVAVAQDFYNDLAEQLNNSHITPLQGQIAQLKTNFQTAVSFGSEIFEEDQQKIASLQGLARDFADLIDGDDLDLERIGNKRDGLLERVRILCGEEH